MTVTERNLANSFVNTKITVILFEEFYENNAKLHGMNFVFFCILFKCKRMQPYKIADMPKRHCHLHWLIDMFGRQLTLILVAIWLIHSDGVQSVSKLHYFGRRNVWINTTTTAVKNVKISIFFLPAIDNRRIVWLL